MRREEREVVKALGSEQAAADSAETGNLCPDQLLARKTDVSPIFTQFRVLRCGRLPRILLLIPPTLEPIRHSTPHHAPHRLG